MTLVPDYNTIKTTGTLSGSGAFSEVYILPGAKAVKVCKHANADAWLWWARYCFENQSNPLLPRIYGLRLDVAENTYTAILDELEEPKFMARSGLYEGVKEPVMKAVGECILSTFYYMTIDIDKSYNWMTKDGAVQITDPLCYHNWQQVKEDTEDRSRLLDWLEAASKHKINEILEVV